MTVEFGLTRSKPYLGTEKQGKKSVGCAVFPEVGCAVFNQ